MQQCERLGSGTVEIELSHVYGLKTALKNPALSLHLHGGWGMRKKGPEKIIGSIR